MADNGQCTFCSRISNIYGSAWSSVMAKIIQFPTRKQLKQQDIVDSLKLEIEYCEENLKEAMQHLDEINEEVVFLTKEYHLLLKELTELTKEKQ